jgi:hypothetical protein
MTFKIGDQIRIDNLDDIDVYDEEYDEYVADEDAPYREDEMWDILENGDILTITRIGMDGNILAGDYWWHPDWVVMHRRKPTIELTGVNATSSYKVVIAKVLLMELERKEKGYAF